MRIKNYGGSKIEYTRNSKGENELRIDGKLYSPGLYDILYTRGKKHYGIIKKPHYVLTHNDAPDEIVFLEDIDKKFEGELLEKIKKLENNDYTFITTNGKCLGVTFLEDYTKLVYPTQNDENIQE